MTGQQRLPTLLFPELVQNLLLQLFLCLQLIAGLELDLLLQAQLLKHLQLCLLQGLQRFASSEWLLAAQLVTRLGQ